MNHVQSTRQNRHNLTTHYGFSYHPMPLFDDDQSDLSHNKKLDLNLYCIKRPQQTCFIRVTDADLLAWGISQGDMLVVEKNESLAIGDLIVVENKHKMSIYEFVAQNNGKLIFFSLSSKQQNMTINNLDEISIVGTVTSCIHQMKPQRTLRFAA
ncbi:MAG: S24 family peptidase [Pasteurellaceae bacterium]|nr:S24 family peptidase [Pasteurellaceae bacterium]